ITMADQHELSFHKYASAYDGAIPSATSLAIMAYAKLGALTGNTKYMNLAYSLVRAHGKQMQTHPIGFSSSLTALMFMNGPRAEIVFSGSGMNSERDLCIQELMNSYLPHAIIAYAESSHDIAAFAPALAKQQTEQELAIFFCENYACSLPLHTLQALKQKLIQLS
ncbi:MAG: hypothetical protein ACKO0Y_03290, partial [Bacteroidota bacterium]